MKNATIYAVVLCLITWAAAAIFASVTGFTGAQSDLGGLLGYNIFAACCMFLPAAVALLMRPLLGKAKCAQKCTTQYSSMLRFRPRWSWLVAAVVAAVSVFLSIGLSGLFIPVMSFKEGTVALMTSSGATPEMVAQSMGPLGNMPSWVMLLATIMSGIFAGVTINALFAFGEEYGWRYFMVGELAAKKFLPASLFIGAVWGIWHSPLILLFGHNYPNDRALGVAMMVLFCIVGGIVELYFVLKSGSVWPAVFIHGTINALAGVGMIMMPNQSPLLYGMTGVAGIASLTVVALLLLIYDRFVSRDNIFGSTLGASLDRNKE